MFNPQRFALARRRRGMKKRELATHIGVTERSVSGYESGTQEPEPGTLAKIAKTLRFPEAFFFGDDPEVPTPDVASFRSLSKMTAGLRDSALGAGAIALLLNDWIEQRFDLPEPDLPDLGSERAALTNFEALDKLELSSSAQAPEAAAEMLRAHWGLGEQPVKNMIALLESKGVRVYSLAIDAKEVDAFSMWSGGRPFMFLNTFKSAERCRFDAAHELGHLVMHQHAHPQGPDLEREANAFASAFLMPRASVLAMAPRSITIKSLIKYKKLWSVSVAALNYRLHSLGLSTEWTYRTLCIQIAQEGYRTEEPESIAHERSVILEKIFAALRADGVGKAGVAGELAISPEEINELTFGLMLNVLKGQSATPSDSGGKSGAHLRLVKG
ncbi:XRE family transcriptional regulator [Pseudomonas aeruginosa]|uniref:XRE family transcriptional regulator n=1 Tax=Pseudomonas citronellolis TaxID=53408 RepID=A0AAW6PFV7_9PSED|nr:MULTISPECIES: XRE family transcriptional regulator [Pseudomonas]MBG4077989.1 XRE family transcriptional regulator [Pseudomonas aeruginosa]MBG4496231.1 XRE family transcriptional regulator [Pseudomonas aeruginosa]MBG5753817.1 XRE family transcriptional regulator [Pseudomonas aeruginosa]MBG7233728.1 XRE family transcriptional regulator [Pseudomonas aeruginosa]MBH3434634.1 XRE family transcriptional regulator [Pseudomonas citronellolis]